jgi:carboxyl-terminal processing protease
MKTRILLTALLFFCIKILTAQIQDSVKAYIDSALHLMQTKSLFANDVDWIRIRDTAYLKAVGTTTYEEAFPAVSYAFQQLKDYHGVIANKKTFYRYPPPVNFDEILSPGIKKEFLKGPRVVTAFFDGSIAYLRVPGMNVTSQKVIDESANELRDSLCNLLNQNPKGIILDLRMNTGGNSAPMISGIGPLFQDTLLGYAVNREGSLIDAIRIKDGILLDESGKKMVNIISNCITDVKFTIAVLTGPSTVSSGEILAAFLKQQPNVKLFGEPTPGFCNATEGFHFMGDNGYLLLTVNRIADAGKQVYQEMLVQPDKYIKSEDNYEDLAADPTVISALEWLKAKTKI